MSAASVFMTWVDYLADVAIALVLLDVATIIFLMFMERCDPRSFFAWMMVFFFVPPVGIILYLYMGRTIYWHTSPYNDPDFWRSTLEGAREDLDEDMKEKGEHSGALKIAEILSNAGAETYTRNNDVRVYTDGGELKDAMFTALRSAKKSILIEYYIIRDDGDGNELMEILIGKVREGIEVRLMTDGFGIKKGPAKAIKRFKAAGGHYAVFHYWLKLLLSPKKSHRNHRKIAMVDGRVAFCGGFNVGDEYRGEGPLGHWRDASVRVEGRGVVPMFMNFSEDWRYVARRDPLRKADDYLDPGLDGYPGVERVQLVSGGPDTMPNNQVSMQYLAMIQNARRRLYITTPYLDPEESIKAALMCAAGSGVDVRILIPDKKDHIFVFWNNMTFANELMEAGVKVYRYHNGFIHEKVVISDGHCCSVGSANLDNRSLNQNFETNVVLYSESLTRQLTDQFLEDLEHSSRYSCEEYNERTTVMKMRMAVSRLLQMFA